MFSIKPFQCSLRSVVASFSCSNVNLFPSLKSQADWKRIPQAWHWFLHDRSFLQSWPGFQSLLMKIITQVWCFTCGNGVLRVIRSVDIVPHTVFPMMTKTFILLLPENLACVWEVNYMLFVELQLCFLEAMAYFFLFFNHPSSIKPCCSCWL